MPTYQYRCADCGTELEVVQKFTDASLTECPTCQGNLRKVYNAVGVVFKGSGFYKTDSREAKSATKQPAAKSESSTGGESGSSDSSAKNTAPSAGGSGSSSGAGTSTGAGNSSGTSASLQKSGSPTAGGTPSGSAAS